MVFDGVDIVLIADSDVYVSECAIWDDIDRATAFDVTDVEGAGWKGFVQIVNFGYKFSECGDSIAAFIKVSTDVGGATFCDGGKAHDAFAVADECTVCECGFKDETEGEFF